MRANKARFALTLSLALVLAACGGGGGGGGDDDGPDSTPPPTGFGDFDGNFTLRGTNPASNDFATTFDNSFPAAFVDGKAMVGSPISVATEFDYPLDAQGGCYYKRGAIDTCVEEADGKVLALCESPDVAEINSVGISDIRDASFNTATLQELISAAQAQDDDALLMQSLNCAGELDGTDTVTVIAPDGTVVQRFGNTQAPLIPSTVIQLFSDTGRPVGSPEVARVGAKAYKHTVGTDVTYYVVTFGAEDEGGGALPPKIFVSVDE